MCTKSCLVRLILASSIHSQCVIVGHVVTCDAENARHEYSGKTDYGKLLFHCSLASASLHKCTTKLLSEQSLTLSPPIPSRLYTLPYWCNPTFFNFWHSGALALRTEHQSARMSKIKTSMPLNPSNSSNLERLVLKGLKFLLRQPFSLSVGRSRRVPIHWRPGGFLHCSVIPKQASATAALKFAWSELHVICNFYLLFFAVARRKITCLQNAHYNHPTLLPKSPIALYTMS